MGRRGGPPELHLSLTSKSEKREETVREKSERHSGVRDRRIKLDFVKQKRTV